MVQVAEYRAWDKIHKHMLKVRGMTFDDQGNIKELTVSMVQCPECSRTFTKIDDFILMRSTGFLDRNGRKIKEGDILRRIDGETRPVIATWSERLGAWILGSRHLGFNQLMCCYFYHDYPTTAYEIIGNVYENPELLKEEE